MENSSDLHEAGSFAPLDVSVYTDYYGLKDKPFRVVPNPDILYRSAKHDDALACLEYGLMENAGIILLTGEIGTGKTTLIRHLINQVGSKILVAEIVNARLNPEELFSLILIEFELNAVHDNKAENLDTLNQFLIANYHHGRRVLLIIDEAQNLPNESLEEIRMLSNLQTDDRLLIQIILVGQPQLREKLMSPDLAQVNQRISASYHLAPLGKIETTEYIKFRLEKAGNTSDLFSDAAVNKIYRASGGIPRVINNICDTALAYAFGDGLKTVDRKVIGRVVTDRAGMGVSAATARYYRSIRRFNVLMKKEMISVVLILVMATVFFTLYGKRSTTERKQVSPPMNKSVSAGLTEKKAVAYHPPKLKKENKKALPAKPDTPPFSKDQGEGEKIIASARPVQNKRVGMKQRVGNAVAAVQRDKEEALKEGNGKAPNGIPDKSVSIKDNLEQEKETAIDEDSGSDYLNLEKLKDPNISIQAIYYSPEADASMVVINNSILRAGQSVNNYYIKRIEREGVVMETNGDEWLLTLAFR